MGSVNGFLRNGPAFSAGYEFRIFRYVAPEFGVVVLLPNNATQYQTLTTFSREHLTLLSFGGRGVLPLSHDRLEVFAGLGGAYMNSSYYQWVGYYGTSRWLFQVQSGFRASLDRRRRFWLGPTVRYSRSNGSAGPVWVSLTADFGFRF